MLTAEGMHMSDAIETCGTLVACEKVAGSVNIVRSVVSKRWSDRLELLVL